jgi:hypothetical protein
MTALDRTSILTANLRAMLTPPGLARRWGVAPDKVLFLIHTGQLRAINLAQTVDGLTEKGKPRRPRWRIPLGEIERFEEARSSKPPAPKQYRRRRRQLATAEKQYF